MTTQTATVSVLGAGSWGTALALALARQGHSVKLWGRDAKAVAGMAEARENKRYLPNHALPPSIQLGHELSWALDQSEWIVLAVPSSAVMELCEACRQRGPIRGIITTQKGMLAQGSMFMHEVFAEALSQEVPYAHLSGPSFASELAQGLPTAVVMAAQELAFAQEAARLFHSKTLRIYTNTDVVGVSIAGALKNVMAIAAGVCDGLGYGNNARAALVTRGLHEMSRFALAQGARQETLYGLSGLGDLLLTASSKASRNYQYGFLLGQGKSPEAAQDEIAQTIEGDKTARIIHQKSTCANMDLPICSAVYQIVCGQADIKTVVAELLARDSKQESALD